MSESESAKRKFKGLLARVFSDGQANEAERRELSAFLSKGALTPDEVTSVMLEFVEQTWKITMADGQITDAERARLREIVDVLELPQSLLPPDWYRALMKA